MSATIHSHPTIRAQVALAVLARVPGVCRHGLGLDEDVTRGGWRLTLVWRLRRVGSQVEMGRAVGIGRSLAEAERDLLAAVCSLPLIAEVS